MFTNSGLGQQQDPILAGGVLLLVGLIIMDQGGKPKSRLDCHGRRTAQGLRGTRCPRTCAHKPGAEASLIAGNVSSMVPKIV